MTIVTRCLYAFIGSHGITDMSLPYDLWVPTYLISWIYSCLFPYRLLLGINYCLSAYHFSYDLFGFIPFWYRFLGYLSCLAILLYFRHTSWSQNTIVGYLAFIHTPLHLLQNLTHHNDTLVMLTFAFMSTNTEIQEYFHKIIRNDEIFRDTRLNRSLLSVLHAHIIVSAMNTHMNTFQ